MKTLRNFLLTGVLILSIYSCDTEGPETFPSAIPKSPDASLNGAFYLSNKEDFVKQRDTEIYISVTMNGEGDLNELGISDLELTHYKIVDTKTGNIRISDGQMIIHTASGNEIRGFYDSWEFDNQTSHDIHVSVRGGSGKFYRSYGNITIGLIKQADGTTRAGVKGSLFYGKDSTL